MKRFALVAVVACSSAPVTPSVEPAPTAKRTPVAEVILDEVVQPKSLAVDATHVYFAGGSTVWRAEKRVGAKAEKLALGTRPVGIALDIAYVWWGDVDGVHRVPKAGGKTERVTTRVFDIAAFAKRGGEMVAASNESNTSNDTMVVRISPDGGIVDAHTVEGREASLAIADDGVYVGTNRAIVRIARNGTQHVIARGDNISVAALVVVGDRVFYAWQHQLFAIAGPTRTIAAEAKGAARSIAVDGTHVYWGTFAEESGIHRIALDGGKPQTFERLGNYAEPTGLAVDGEYLYWTNEQSGQVLRKRR